MKKKSLIEWLEVIGLCLVGLFVLYIVCVFCRKRKNARKQELASKDTEQMLEDSHLQTETEKELFNQRQPHIHDKESQIS